MRKKALLLILVLLSACARTEKATYNSFYEYPPEKFLKIPGMMDIPTFSPGSPLPFDASKTASMAIDKVVTSLKRGTPIAKFTGEYHYYHEENLYLCGSRIIPPPIEWDGNKKHLADLSEEITQRVHETMKEEGFLMLGAPSELYGVNEKRAAADLRLAMTITQITGNLCDNFASTSFDAHTRAYRLGAYSGEFMVKVTWTLYDHHSKKTLGEVETTGYAREMKPSKQGINAILIKAVDSAAKELHASRKFIDLVTREGVRTTTVAQTVGADPITLSAPKLDDREIREKTDHVLKGTVLVRSSDGHGSGFIVSKDGHLLTAAHVVGDAKKVMLKFNNGLELEGEVLRVSKVRDVALIKVGVGGLSVLDIGNVREVELLEEVYAVGAPLDEEMRSTMTKGVVSALRTDERNLSLIQADVATFPGNSGGPLLNKQGGVVGICVSGLQHNGVAGALNFFVPIADALKHLNIEVAREVTR